MQQQVVGTRFGLSVGVGQVEVFASAAAWAAVREAERVAQIAAGAPADVAVRPARLSEQLLTPAATRSRVQAVLQDIADAQAALHALQAAAISRLAELQPAQTVLPGARPDDPADPDRPDDWVADEVAVVLGIGVGSAAVLVDKQRVLFEQLPGVWEALADGRIDVRRAQVLVEALAHRKRSAGGGLADDVVDAVARQGLQWIAEGIGPTPLADRIAGALIAADPAEADRRAERRKRRQNVTTVGAGDGLAGLRADLLDAADAAAMQAVVDAMASAMRKGGDRRPIGVLRVAALTQLLTRPWETLPEDVARAGGQLRLRVDLADLDDLGPLLEPRPAPTPRAHLDPADLPDSAEPRAPAPGADCDPAGAPEGARAPRRTATSSSGTADDWADASGGAGSVDTDVGAGHDAELVDLPDDPARPAPPRSSDDADARGAGSGVGAIDGLAVSPVAVAELLARYEALLVTGTTGPVAGGGVWFEIVDATGRLRALTTPAEARAAVRRGTGLGPPPAVDRYSPSAAQVRFVQARDRHCRFPGCSGPAEYVDLDHVVPRDHDDPAAGGPTCVTNLVCLCRRHHRLKTHAPGWVFAMDPDGTLHVTPPGGRTRTTRPACIAEVDMSTPTSTDRLTDLLGPTPARFRTSTPDERAARRATAAERARLAAEIAAELDVAACRLAADRNAAPGDHHPTPRDRPAEDTADDEGPPF